MMKRWKSTVLGSLIFGLIGTAQAELSIATSSKSMSLNYNQCIRNAKQVLRQKGFEYKQGNDSAAESARTKDGSGAAWGGEEAGQYTALIRCVPGAQIVFFVVVGPADQHSQIWRYISQLSHGFAAED